jgi:hypothetical protein
MCWYTPKSEEVMLEMPLEKSFSDQSKRLFRQTGWPTFPNSMFCKGIVCSGRTERRTRRRSNEDKWLTIAVEPPLASLRK